MKKLVLFTQYYNPEDYINIPLPVDVFNKAGAILAPQGHTLPEDKLYNAYVHKKDEDFHSHIEDEDTWLSEDDNGGEEMDLDDIPVYMTESYTEETPEDIENRIKDVSFHTIQKLEKVFSNSSRYLNKMFDTKAIGDTVVLATGENEKLSNSFASFLDTILNKNLYASEYMDMISAVRAPENYLTFSHSSSVAFYALSIMRKLSLLKESFTRGEWSKWKPVRTKKNEFSGGMMQIPTSIIRYIDRQVEVIKIKYKPHIYDQLFERANDRIYDYYTINPEKDYPSLNIDFSNENMRTLTMAALNHDIGKIVIPNKILNKNSKLTRQEFRLMQKHPVYSVNKLQEIKVANRNMLAYILAHHRLSPEKGYPPMKQKPPEEAKIIAIADIYDAMTAETFYHNAIDHTEALEYIQVLHEEGIFDLPLYVCAVHTFEEFNHEFLRFRTKRMVDF